MSNENKDDKLTISVNKSDKIFRELRDLSARMDRLETIIRKSVSINRGNGGAE